MKYGGKIFKKPGYGPPLSQLICSITNFIFNFLGISIFIKKDFTTWFLVSLINVFLQSINRSSFLELYILRKLSPKLAIIKSLFLVIFTNSSLWIFCVYSRNLKSSEAMMLAVMFTFYQIQDIFRYIVLRNNAFLVVKSDSLILAVVIFIFLYNIFNPISVNFFVITNLIAFILGAQILLKEANHSLKNNEINLAAKFLVHGMFFSNLLLFILSISTIAIMEKFMSISDLIDYRIIVLWLSPAGALIRIVWVKKIALSKSNILKNELFNDAIAIIKLFSLVSFTALLFLGFFYQENVNFEMVFSFILGLFSIAINAWTFPLLIKIREHDSAVINAVITASGAITSFIYVLIFYSAISIVFLYFVNLMTQIFVAFYTYIRTSKYLENNRDFLK